MICNKKNNQISQYFDELIITLFFYCLFLLAMLRLSCDEQK